MNNLFILDMLLLSLAAAAPFRRRKYFWVRLPVAFAACVTVSYYSAQFINTYIKGEYLGVFQGGVGYLVQFFLLTAFLLLCFRLTVWKALYLGAASYLIQHSAFAIDRLLRGEIDGAGWNWWVLVSHYLILFAVLAVVWLLFLRKVNDETLDRVNLRRVGPVVVIMLAACLFLNQFANNYGQNDTAFRVADLTCNIFGLCYQYSVLNVSVLEGENDKIQKLLRQSVEQYRVSKENIDLINVKCHDLRHQIRAFHRDGKIDGALLGEIERVVDNYDCSMRTGNAALDVILTEKSLLCRSKGIRFTCIADGAGLSYMNAYDVYALFGNALENAMEAAEQLEDPEKKFISLTLRPVERFYSVNLQNYVDRAVEIDDRGMPVTHKKDKQNHGFGVRSMCMLAEKYGGELSYKVEGNVFNLNMVLPYVRESGGKETHTEAA